MFTAKTHYGEPVSEQEINDMIVLKIGGWNHGTSKFKETFVFKTAQKYTTCHLRHCILWKENGHFDEIEDEYFNNPYDLLECLYQNGWWDGSWEKIKKMYRGKGQDEMSFVNTLLRNWDRFHKNHPKKLFFGTLKIGG